MNESTPRGSVTRRDALRITAVAGVSLALGGVTLGELIRAGRLKRVQITDSRMGTLVGMTIVHPDAAVAREMVTSAFAEMDRLERILSRHNPAASLARLNLHGTLERAPEELVEVVSTALRISSLSEGAFDVTVAPLLELFERRFAEDGEPPSDSEIARTLGRVGYQGIRIEGPSISLQAPGMSVTLDGVAKGYIVDRTVSFLQASGASSVMVNGGGDIASSPVQGGTEAWRVGIQHPRDARLMLGSVRISGEGVATSGDYMQSFTADRKHHHVIDPRTGRSPAHVSSVTVIAPTAMEADALSTAALVLEPGRGLQLLERLSGVEALMVTKEGERLSTRGFDDFRG